MRTNSPYDLHDHSGWRWLAPALAVLLAVILLAVLMILYPHLLG